MPHGVAAALARGGLLELPTLRNLAVCSRGTLAEGGIVERLFPCIVCVAVCVLALRLAAFCDTNSVTCVVCETLPAVAGELRLHASHDAAASALVGLREWARTISEFISARAFSLADSVAWNRRGLCQPGRDGDGLSFTAAPGVTDGRLTVARLGNERFRVMLGVPIRHGVVRWEVLLHRGNDLAIGCAAWPVVGPKPQALHNTWMWYSEKSDVLFRGTPGPAGPKWPVVFADGAGE